MQEAILVNRRKSTTLHFQITNISKKHQETVVLGQLQTLEWEQEVFSPHTWGPSAVSLTICLTSWVALCQCISGNFSSNALLKGNLNFFWRKKKKLFPLPGTSLVSSPLSGSCFSVLCPEEWNWRLPVILANPLMAGKFVCTKDYRRKEG